MNTRIPITPDNFLKYYIPVNERGGQLRNMRCNEINHPCDKCFLSEIKCEPGEDCLGIADKKYKKYQALQLWNSKK